MDRIRRIKYLKRFSRLHWPTNPWKSFGAILVESVRELNKSRLLLSLVPILLLFLVSCGPQQRKLAAANNLSGDEQAQLTLMDFLNNLQSGKYDEADRLYGGSYQTMIDQNPNIDPNDHPGLLRNACTLNGLQCLEAKIIGLEEEIPNEKYVFMVEFLKINGTLFRRGPCCGEDEGGSLPQSVFLFTVSKVDQNKFAVMDLPPYGP